MDKVIIKDRAKAKLALVLRGSNSTLIQHRLDAKADRAKQKKQLMVKKLKARHQLLLQKQSDSD